MGGSLARASASRIPAPRPAGWALRRSCACAAGGRCEECGGVRRAAAGPATPAVAPPAVHDVLRSPGQPLDPTVRGLLEGGFGHDFSRVRVHTNASAADSARAVGAAAYTVGSHIVFGGGRYQPASTDGRRLLAHELTHVVQQGVPDTGHVPAAPLPIDDSGEWEAERVSAAVLAGRAASPTAAGSGLAVQRQIPIPWFEPMPLPRPIPMPRVGPMPEVGPMPFAPGDFPEVDVRPEVEIEDLPEADELPQTEEPAPESEPTPDEEPAPQPRPLPPVGPQPAPDDPDEDPNRCGSRRLPNSVVTFPTQGAFGQAGVARASPLTRCPPLGGIRGSQAVETPYKAQFNCIRAAGRAMTPPVNLRRIWYPAHLLHGKTRRTGNQTLHGPGNDRKNIIIGDVGMNTSMGSVEQPVLNLVYRHNGVLWYEAKVDSYVPGNEFFAESITVRYGLYDVNTNTEGPPIGPPRTFTRTHQPPTCPPSLPAVVPPVLPGLTRLRASTLSICRQVLRSRVLNVPNGGLRVTLRAGWVAKGQFPCPPLGYTVTLKRQGIAFDDTISTSSVPADRAATLTWRRLLPGDYFLDIEAPLHNPFCCLEGDVSFDLFDDPRGYGRFIAAAPAEPVGAPA